MSTFQKIIKYGAIAFAIYLSIMIIGVIITVLTAIFGVTVGIENFKNNKDNVQNIGKQISQEYENINKLDIELGVCKLDIKKGDKLKVETFDVSENFECKTNNNKLTIKDNGTNWNWFKNENITPKVIIYIPESISFEEIEISTGVNDTNIEYLNTNKLDLEIGVGKCNIENIIAENTKIECGAGETTILNSNIGTLKLDSGIGKLVITSKITKSADIDSGVGNVEVNLKGKESDYLIDADTGLGNFMVNNKKISDHTKIGNGDVTIKVDAGVGETKVNFTE